MSQTLRISHIDSLRGAAVILMVMVHAAATWNPFEGAQNTILAYIVSGLGGLAAPLFLSLFGWGIFRSKLNIKARIFQATFLFAAQILVNLSSPHLFNPFTPGILSLMAILTLLFPILTKAIKNCDNRLLPFILILVFSIQTLSPQVQGTGDWGARVDDSSFLVILSNLLFTGTYPLFPWFIFPCLGAIISFNSKETKQTLPLNNYTKSIIGTGLIFCIITLAYSQYNGELWAHPSADAYLTFFPANPAFIIAAITGVLLIWAFIQYAELVWLNSTGKISLTIYLIHFIPLSLMHQFDTKYEWGLYKAATFVLLYTIFWIPIAIFWMRHWPKINFETILRQIRKNYNN